MKMYPYSAQESWIDPTKQTIINIPVTEFHVGINGVTETTGAIRSMHFEIWSFGSDFHWIANFWIISVLFP